MSRTGINKGAVQADVPREFLSVKEFAATTGIALDTAYRMTQRGDLAWVRIGGEKRIPVSEITRLTEEAMAQVSA